MYFSPIDFADIVTDSSTAPVHAEFSEVLSYQRSVRYFWQVLLRLRSRSYVLLLYRRNQQWGTLATALNRWSFEVPRPTPG